MRSALMILLLAVTCFGAAQIDSMLIKKLRVDTSSTLTIPTTTGSISWNATDGTIDVGMVGGIIMQVGQEMFAKVRNADTVTLTDGTPVYISGRTGIYPDVKRAMSSNDTMGRCLGIVADPILTTGNKFGYITTHGYVRGIKTNYSGAGKWGTTWVAGDKLYISKDSVGTLTNIEPAVPHHSDMVGTVGVVSASGSILVLLEKHQTLEELTDVNGTALTITGQFPVWNNTTKYFDFNNNIFNMDSIYAKVGKFQRGRIDTLYGGQIYSIKDTAQKGIFDSANIHKYLRFDTLSQHPGNGAIWNDAQHRAITTWTNGMEGVLSRTIFDACNNPHDTNSTSEVSLKGYDSTDANIPDSLSAGFFKKWKMLQFFYAGTYTTKTAPAGTMILRIKMNATVICSTIVTLDPSETENSWTLQGTVVCRDTGTSGKLSLCTNWVHGQLSGASNIVHAAPIKTIRGGATVNTNIKQRPDITAQFSSATINSIYVCSGYWLERH